MGRPAKDFRLVTGAVIIKHKLKLSDKETVFLSQENRYLQYFCGLPGFQTESPFAPSLFVEIRRRMGAAVFEQFHQAIFDQMEGRSGQSDDQGPSSSNDARSAASIEPETESNQPSEPQATARKSPTKAGSFWMPQRQNKQSAFRPIWVYSMKAGELANA